MSWQCIGRRQTTLENNRSYGNGARAVIAVRTGATDAIAKRIDRKRLLIVNRSIHTLYVANDTAENKPASSANTEIEIPGEHEYEFPIVPLTAINLAWASNATPDATPEALE